MASHDGAKSRGDWLMGRYVPKGPRMAKRLGIDPAPNIWYAGIDPSQYTGSPTKHHFAHDAAASHDLTFAVNAYENKQFLPILKGREHGIAPSWGHGYWDISWTRTDRGRQRQWCKDFWHLQWQRLWRWSPYRAAMTVRRGSSHLTRLFSRPAAWRATRTSNVWCGRTIRFVRGGHPRMGVV